MMTAAAFLLGLLIGGTAGYYRGYWVGLYNTHKHMERRERSRTKE
jgi:membrane protein DedA with SNARE-associated domain